MWRRLSNCLERGISLQLPSRRASVAAIYEQPKELFALGRYWTDNGLLEMAYAQVLPFRGMLLKIAACLGRPPSLPHPMASIINASIETSHRPCRSQQQRSSSSSSTRLSFSSAGNLFGWQHLHCIWHRRLWVGTEIYYGGTENSGGCMKCTFCLLSFFILLANAHFFFLFGSL